MLEEGDLLQARSTDWWNTSERLFTLQVIYQSVGFPWRCLPAQRPEGRKSLCGVNFVDS